MKFIFIHLYELEGPSSESDRFIEENGKRARRLAEFLEGHTKEGIMTTFKCSRMVVLG